MHKIMLHLLAHMTPDMEVHDVVMMVVMFLVGYTTHKLVARARAKG